MKIDTAIAMEKSSFKRKQTNGIDSSSSGKEFKKTPHHHHKGSPSGHPQKYDKYDKHSHKDFKKSKQFKKRSFFSKLWSFIIMVLTCGLMRHSNKPSPNAGEVRHCKGCNCSKETAPKHNPKPHSSKTDEAPVAKRVPPPGPKAPQANTTDECEAPQPVKARLTPEEIAKYKAQYNAFRNTPGQVASRYRPRVPIPDAESVASATTRHSASEDDSHSQPEHSESEPDVEAEDEEEFDTLVDSDDE